MRKFSLCLLAILVAACVQSGTGDPEADGSVPSVDASVNEDASAPPPDAPPGAPTLVVTATPMTINLGQSTNISWLTSNMANCKSRGDDQPLNGTYTVSPTVDTVYTVVCTGLNGVGIMDHANVTVIQPPSTPAPTVDVSATLTTINLGQNTTVTWQSTNAESCTNSETSSQATAGTFTVHPYMTTTYAVVCSGPGGQAQDSINVIVVPPPPPTLDVTATPTSITVGQSTTVSWNSENAMNCWSLNSYGNWVPQPIDGSWSGLMPTTTTTYSLTCYNSSYDVVTDSVTVVVNAAPPPPPPTLTVTASPNTINVGGTTTVTWTSVNAASCRSLNSSGNWVTQPLSGSWSGLMPTTTTTYSLTCEGPGGSITRGALVTVNPLLTLNFSASPSTIDAGESSCLSWASTNATSCTIESVSKPTSGTMTVSPNVTKTYTATCNGPGGQQVTRTATVTVVQHPLPTLSFSATPATITMGQSSTLSWSTANATSCTATGSWSGSKPVNGTLVVSPTANAKYLLSCTGPGGTVNGTADVWVNLPPNHPPTVSITSPANNATFVAPASFTVTSSASDPDAGDTVVVQLYKGGAPFGSGANGQLSNLVAGTYVLTAKATDNHGAETVSAPVTITVTQPQTPNQPPSVSLASNNSIFFVAPATVELRASASDSDGTVARVEFKNGNALLFNDTSAPFEYNWANVPVGVYSTTAVAFDDDGASATSNQLTITVSASSGDVPCHGLGIYFSNTKLNTITSCSKWDKLGAGSSITKNNFIDGGIGACGITCSNSSGVTVLPDAVTGVWLQNGTSDVSRWYTTGCANLPPHPPEAPQAGGAWDKRCQVSTNPLGGPPDTNN